MRTGSFTIFRPSASLIFALIAFLRSAFFIVAGNSGKWIHFDYVPGERNIRRGSADITGRICVIGSGIDEKSVREIFLA